MRADKSKIIDLFADDTVDVPSGRQPVKQKAKAKEQPKTAMQTNKERFNAKLEAEQFQDFDHKDWFQYFTYKAQTKGIRYITRNYAKEYAIIKSILNEMSWVDLKNMIDFVFDSNQDIVDKRTVGLFIVSKGWINTTYQSTQLWLEGAYKPRKAPLHNREWKAEASRKESGTGLTYGKPVRDEIEEVAKPTRKISKGRISF